VVLVVLAAVPSVRRIDPYRSHRMDGDRDCPNGAT
jgi:hypothetical protein